MRPEFDSEIDSVLRGHARRGGALPAAWDAGSRPSISNEAQSGSHLDADEIAAFGEDALPAAARARYSAHLADCDDCRRSVTQVVMAAGVADRINERAGAAATAGVAEGVGERGLVSAAAAAFATRSPSAATQSSPASTQSPAATTQSPSWRERLSAIFAPRAWRYAMPVVALVAVSAVVLVVTRRVPREGLLERAADRGAATQTAPAPAAPEAHHAGAPQTQPSSAQAGTETSNANAAAVTSSTEADADPNVAGEVAKTRPKSIDGLDQSAPGATVGAAGARLEVGQKAQSETVPATTQNYAGLPTPLALPPAAAPAPVMRDVAPLPQPTPAPPREYAEAQPTERSRDDGRAAGALSRDEAPATKRHGPQRAMGVARSAELSSAANATKDDRAASRRARGPAKNEANRNEPAEEAKAKRAEEDRDKRAGEDREQQAETRSVLGRRFRRDGNVWIDTAYRTGQATVVVRRDSEQYRSLVGDVPQIGQISRALGGEAVIVWKGRAYRIKP